jgi:CheY-like chemotaxis protein
VIEANNGRDGLKAIHEHRPELVILDLMMPEMDGFSVLQALKQDTVLHNIPVIVLSAKSLTPQEQAELRPQISSVIEKASFDRQEFLYIVHDILR